MTRSSPFKPEASMTRTTLLLPLILAACKFPDLGPIDPDGQGIQDDGASMDSPSNDGASAIDAATAIDATTDGPPVTWSALLPLPVNRATDPETSPHLAPDNLTLYFAGMRDDALGTLDIKYTERTSTTGAFGAGQLTGTTLALNGGWDDSDPFVSQDYFELYYVRQGNILVSRRASLVETWPAPTDTTIDGAQPMLTQNGLTLYYLDTTVTCPVQTCRSKRTRATVLSAWGAPVVESFPPGGYRYVHVSNDGLRVLLSDVLSLTAYQVAVAYRSSVAEPWGSPTPITQFGTGARIKAARWSWDESELYVAFEENGGVQNLYVSRPQ